MPKYHESNKSSNNERDNAKLNSLHEGSTTLPVKKKIVRPKKLLFHEQEKHDISTTRVVKKLEDSNDLSEYTRNQSCKMDKIKKRTMMIVNFDKYVVKHAAEALIVNHKTQVEQGIVKL